MPPQRRGCARTANVWKSWPTVSSRCSARVGGKWFRRRFSRRTACCRNSIAGERSSVLTKIDELVAWERSKERRGTGHQGRRAEKGSARGTRRTVLAAGESTVL